MIDYLPLLALAIPLLGAGVIAWVPALGAHRSRLLIGALLATLALLVIVGNRPTHITEITYWGNLVPVGQSLRFAYDHLGFTSALALLLGLLSASVLQETEGHERHGPATTLLVAGAGLAIVSAASVATLCLSWVLLDLGLFWTEARTAYRSRRARGGRALLLRTLSTGLLIAGTALLLADLGDPALPLLLPRGVALHMLMAAALLRVGAYPLPGSSRGSWLWSLVSITIGTYLWLRVAQLSAARFPVQSWPAALAAMSLLLTALLAGVRPPESRSIRYLAAHWVALIVLAPFLDVTGGYSIALAAMLTSALGVVPLMADATAREEVDTLRLLTRGGLLVCAGGLPLTTGFVARWALLRLLWDQGQGALFAVVLLALALASWPSGHQLLRVARQVGAQRPPVTLRRQLPGVLALAAPSLLIVAGVVPDVMERLSEPLVGRALLPSPGGFLADGGRGGGWAVAAAALLPMALSLTTARAKKDVLARLAGSPASLQAFLELEWLYSPIERAAAWLQAQVCRGLSLLEGSLALGWMLLWLVAAALYLTGG